MTRPTDRSNKNRPGITGIGQCIQEPDHSVTVRGWGLTLCAARCECHYNPRTKTCQIQSDNEAGTLGLRHFTNSGKCICCQPWTAEELEAVLTELNALASIETTDEPTTEAS